MQPTPRWTRLVTPASAPSKVSESGLGLAPRLSPTQTELKSGFASTLAARVSISVTLVTPKKTPRCGKVKPTVGLIASAMLGHLIGRNSRLEPRDATAGDRGVNFRSTHGGGAMIDMHAHWRPAEL